MTEPFAPDTPDAFDRITMPSSIPRPRRGITVHVTTGMAAGLLASLLVACAGTPATPAVATPPPSAAPAATSPPVTPEPPARVVGALDRIRNAGVLRIGVLAQMPWASLDREGRWMGFDIDVGERLAQDLGVRAEFVRVGWQTAADDAAQGHVDLVAGLWPGPRRALVVDFSPAYAVAEVNLVARRQAGPRVRPHQDLDRPTVRLGVRPGGLSEQVARERFPQARLVPIDTDEDQLAALLDGRIDALVARTPVPELLVAAAPGRLSLPLAQPLSRRSETFAVARTPPHAELASWLDAWVHYSTESGWLRERRAYWFRGTAWQSRL